MGNKLLRRMGVMLALTALLAGAPVQQVQANDFQNETEHYEITEKKSYSAFSCTIEEDETTVQALSVLNVYSAPDYAFQILGSVEAGTVLRRVGITSNGWSKVEYNGINGFVENTGVVEAIQVDTSIVVPDFIQAYGNVEYIRLQKAYEYFNFVPVNIMNAFINDGWKIYVCEGDIASSFRLAAAGSIAGLCDYNQKLIYLDDSGIGTKALVHEMGHYADFKCNNSSLRLEFIDIYYAEAYNVGGYAMSDNCEFFAEVFSLGLIDPVRCNQVAPAAYQYVASNVAGIQ